MPQKRATIKIKLPVFDRQADLKHRSAVVFGFYRSPVQGNYLPCEGKTDPCSVLSGAEEAVEDMRQQLGRNALAVVTDTDDGLSSFLRTFDFYFLFSIAQSVGDDVCKNSAKLNFVTA